jgi:hypothetical protein
MEFLFVVLFARIHVLPVKLFEIENCEIAENNLASVTPNLQTCEIGGRHQGCRNARPNIRRSSDLRWGRRRRAAEALAIARLQLTMHSA